ncbi:MAG: hypothetical protein EPN75_07870 [Beijerinckiaceae bacterium]|nr:MAG: hypothetical protein EPN75_07870 [Beijerinckiaceae bacterium]
MQIDPRLAFALNVLLMIVSGIATGAVHFTGIVPDPVAAQIIGWAGFATFILSTVNTALHGYSAASSGPFVARPNRPPRPSSKIVSLLILVALIAASGLLPSSPAHAAPLKFHAAPHSSIKHHVPPRQKLSLNLNLLLTQLQKVSLQDLQTAKADADAQKDAVASTCYAQIITLVTNQETALKAQQNLPDVHVVTTFQQVRDFALALRQGSPLSTACAPLANEVKMDVLNFVAGVTAGSLSLASFGL